MVSNSIPFSFAHRRSATILSRRSSVQSSIGLEAVTPGHAKKTSLILSTYGAQTSWNGLLSNHPTASFRLDIVYTSKVFNAVVDSGVHMSLGRIEGLYSGTTKRRTRFVMLKRAWFIIGHQMRSVFLYSQHCARPNKKSARNAAFHPIKAKPHPLIRET